MLRGSCLGERLELADGAPLAAGHGDAEDPLGESNVASSVLPPGLVQSFFLARASINSLQLIGLWAWPSTLIAACTWLILFGSPDFACLVADFFVVRYFVAIVRPFRLEIRACRVANTAARQDSQLPRQVRGSQ